MRLFARSERLGARTAVTYTLIGTAMLNEVAPHALPADENRTPELPAGRLRELLP